MLSKRPTPSVRNAGNPYVDQSSSKNSRSTGSKIRKWVRVLTPLSIEVCASEMRQIAATILRRFLSKGREFATGRKVAIKKIKVGQFKDGLDMSAIREVKYLRELRHHNVIEVLALLHVANSLLLTFRTFSFSTYFLPRRILTLFWNSSTPI